MSKSKGKVPNAYDVNPMMMEQFDQITPENFVQFMMGNPEIVSEILTNNKFNISKRTIYRDIKALEQSGVPVLTEEGKGYTLMDGYKIPPVMFTEKQANALILAEQLVLNSKDASFVKEIELILTYLGHM